MKFIIFENVESLIHGISAYCANIGSFILFSQGEKFYFKLIGRS